jgi:hypothetical protein
MAKWVRQINGPQYVQQIVQEAVEALRKGLESGPAVLTLTRPTRSLEQNRLMWPLLKDFEEQAELFGQKIDAIGWKIVLTDAFNGETEYLPKLDGKGMVSRAIETKIWPKDTFSSFIEFMFAEGAEKNVVWSYKSKETFSEMGVGKA